MFRGLDEFINGKTCWDHLDPAIYYYSKLYQIDTISSMDDIVSDTGCTIRCPNTGELLRDIIPVEHGKLGYMTGVPDIYASSVELYIVYYDFANIPTPKCKLGMLALLPQYSRV